MLLSYHWLTGQIARNNTRWIFRWAWTDVSDNVGNVSIYVAVIVLSCIWEVSFVMYLISVCKKWFSMERETRLFLCNHVLWWGIHHLLDSSLQNSEIYSLKRETSEIYCIIFIFSMFSYEFFQCYSLIFIASSAVVIRCSFLNSLHEHRVQIIEGSLGSWIEWKDDHAISVKVLAQSNMLIVFSLIIKILVKLKNRNKTWKIASNILWHNILPLRIGLHSS